jgi:single-stranded DNA-binding protein
MFSLVRSSVPRASTRVSILSSHFRRALTDFSVRLFVNSMRRVQAFSTSVPRKVDVSKVILVGRLGREPEVKTTKSDKEYVSLVSSPPLHQYSNNLLTPVTFTGTLLPLPTIPPLLRVLTAVSGQIFVCYSEDRSPPAARPEPGVTWHRILSFNNSANNYLRNLSRGSRVYVEANLEVRDPDRDAEPGSPAATRQVFLRHGMSPTT